MGSLPRAHPSARIVRPNAAHHRPEPAAKHAGVGCNARLGEGRIVDAALERYFRRAPCSLPIRDPHRIRTCDRASVWVTTVPARTEAHRLICVQELPPCPGPPLYRDGIAERYTRTVQAGTVGSVNAPPAAASVLIAGTPASDFGVHSACEPTSPA